MKHFLFIPLALLVLLNVHAKPVKTTVSTVTIPTYIEPEREDLPMFAENRVHQRTSGNPYPNKIVLKVNREEKVDKKYTLITIENDYLEIQILPELGGKIYSAKDKTNGYDFFYKNHVIKPALIGALGSWTSGGLEFNWPYHHRASSFMPVDYEIEKLPNGGVIVWMSEHDPVDRMKGTVGVVLNPDESIFETRMRLSNTTPTRRSFLWWENVAVPSNKSYEIFFPKDVSHVHFHYKRSVTTYPIASNATGIFNGIRYDGEVDISQHKNTIQPTSYFSAASDYDFFGGYDNGLKSGVVHIGDHHVSPGKKMFTWAYNQLSDSWENALTDTDGAYCELMAGSYSDNQPDFAWLEPMETKIFSQYWFPIGELGVPEFANTFGAIHCKEAIRLQLNKTQDVKITIDNGKDVIYSANANIKARKEHVLPSDIALELGSTITIASKNGTEILRYTKKEYDQFDVAGLFQDMPNLKEVESPYQLYLEGLHVDQYRDPAIKCDSYYAEAIKRDPNFAPALIALGEYKYRNAFYDEALELLLRAKEVNTQYNAHFEDGKLYYLIGHTYLQMENYAEAYDYFQKSAWNSGYASAAMTYISMLDIRNKQYHQANQHLTTVLGYNKENVIANALMVYSLYLNGDTKLSENQLQAVEKNDKLNHLARYFGVLTKKITQKDFFGKINTDKNQVCLDLVDVLLTANLKDEAISLIQALKGEEALNYSMSAIYAELTDSQPDNNATEGIAYPNRPVEIKYLQKWADKGNEKAKSQLACALYSKGHYGNAANLWEDTHKQDFTDARNLAIAYYSHLDKKDEVLDLLQKALDKDPTNEQLIFELAYVMGKMGVDPEKRIAFLNGKRGSITRDDIMLEWARAYNMAGQEDKALELLKGRNFIPAEGGEHAVAEQYMMAYYLKGRKLMLDNQFEDAAACFKEAQTLPQNLGAGLWNIVKLVPYKYYEAICLKALGKDAEATENFKFITDIEIDYFSNMHVPELPYYQALCYREQGMKLKGDMMINYKIKDWKEGIKKADAGFFSTTPFFISFCDQPQQQRTAYFSYLLTLAYSYTNNSALEAQYLEQAYKNDPYALNIFALYLLHNRDY